MIVDMALSDEEKKLLLRIARETLEFYIRYKKVPPFDVSSPGLLEKRGAFVSLHKEGELRGCIGVFTSASDKPLYLTVLDMAIAASTQDPRFLPVGVDELPFIGIEISALTPLKRINDISEIEVGRHGIYIVKGLYRGVLLPQVATEYGWDRETFLDHTCLKAGLPPDSWKGDVEIYTFEAEVFGELPSS
ncbi:MAG: AmmeMemoRadiSam system protein A [Deltaproteobacteria bacterium]|nr:AmmeMemoRadiSam system protein A [Deltaproteobacteria bacterium]